MVAQDQEVLPEGKPASHAQDRAALPPCLRHANGSARWYFPDGSAPGRSAESAPYGQKSPVLAGRVRSDLISLLGGSLRRFPSGGISSLRRRVWSVPLGVVEVMDMTTEGAHLEASGLNRGCWDHPPNQSSLYKETVHLEVEAFTSWCGDRLPARPSQLPSWYSSGVPAGLFLHKVDPLHPRGLRGGHCGLTLQKQAFRTWSPPILATHGSLFSRPSCALPQYTKQGFESLAAWASRSTQLEFLKRNVSDYICNPSSSRERDAASRGHTSGIPSSACFIPRSWRRFLRTCFYASWSLRHPARDISLIHGSDYTRYSECGHAEGVLKGFDTASRSFKEYVTEMFSFTKVYKELNGNK